MQEHSQTFEDTLNAEHIVEELINGKKILSPQPIGKHIYAASALGAIIGTPFQRGLDGPGGWWILDEPELLIQRNKLIPDLAGWRKERMPKLPKGYLFEIPPDWVCELVSESSRKIDRTTKPEIYLKAGIKYLWIIDPEDRTLEVFRASPDGWVVLMTGQDEDILRAEPFQAVELPLSLLWAEVE